MSLSRIDLDAVSGVPLIGLKEVSIEGWDLFCKRLLDLCLTIIALVPLSVVMAAVAIVLVALPWFLPLIGGYKELATRIVLWAIFALGFDILLGLTGFLSFGHAAFWGVSAYIAGFMLLHIGMNTLWTTFAFGDDAVGGWLGNALRLLTVATALIATRWLAPPAHSGRAA